MFLLLPAKNFLRTLLSGKTKIKSGWEKIEIKYPKYEQQWYVTIGVLDTKSIVLNASLTLNDSCVVFPARTLLEVDMRGQIEVTRDEKWFREREKK